MKDIEKRIKTFGATKPESSPWDRAEDIDIKNFMSEIRRRGINGRPNG